MSTVIRLICCWLLAVPVLLWGQTFRNCEDTWYLYGKGTLTRLNMGSDGFYRALSHHTFQRQDSLIAGVYHPQHQAIYGMAANKTDVLMKINERGDVTPIPIAFPHYIQKAIPNTAIGKAMEYLDEETIVLYTTGGDSLVFIALQDNRAQCRLLHLSQRVVADALALHPSNGLLYTIDRYGILYEIAPATGFVHLVGKLANIPNKDKPYPALWFSQDGRLWARRAESPDLWMVDIQTVAAYNIYADLSSDYTIDLHCATTNAPVWLDSTFLYLNALPPQRNAVIKINWGTANDLLTDYYQLERSADHRLWEPHGTPKYATNIAKTLIPYGELDRMRADKDTFYYRILRLDIDGRFHYSPSIQFPIPTTYRQRVGFVSPTLGQDHRALTLQGWQGQSVVVRVKHSITGHVYYERRLTIEGSDYKIALSADRWLHGWYTVTVVSDQDGYMLYDKVMFLE